MELFEQFDTLAFESFIDETKKKYDLKSDTKDIKDMIVEDLKNRAIKMRKNNEMYVPVIVGRGEIEKAIIKCSSHVKAWKSSKENKDKKDSPRNVTIGNDYYDKNGQKHTKKKSDNEKKGDTFDLTQLELFDFGK